MRNEALREVTTSLPIAKPTLDRAVMEFRTAVQGQNETRRKELFIVLLTRLFPDHTSQIQRFAGGAEEYVKVERPSPGESSRGFIDTFFGNLVIEFEHNLKKMLSTAEGQIQGYVAKLWSTPSNYRAYLGIATDGVSWRVYSPLLKEPEELPIQSENIELRFVESFDLERATPTEFYFWLDRILFRDNSLPPTSGEICRDFGMRSHAFSVGAKLITDKLKIGFSKSEIKSAYDTWEHYLKYTYGEIDGTFELFVKHTYLSCFTKLLMGNVLAAKKGHDLSMDDIVPVLDGSYFQQFNLRNYVEKDFFHWVNFEELGLEPLWLSLFHSLRTYDFTSIQSDFLKEIYQDLIDPNDRHDLGEYYTPDWLCEKIVNEFIALKKNGETPRVADITCGSGSFLRAAINKIKDINSAQEPAETLKDIVESVTGFEIHPLAVFTAKTNYILALGDLLDSSDNPLNLPIYLCDSLLSPELTDADASPIRMLELRLGEERVSIPWEMAQDSETFDKVVSFCDRVAHSHAKSEVNDSQVETGAERFITETYKTRLEHQKECIQSLTSVIALLSTKIRAKKNSIWSYVLRNNYKPVFMSNRYDFVVGNPPWLSYRYIADPNYKREIEFLSVERYGIAPQNSELRTQMELATVFLAHAVSKYLSSSGKLIFVMPRSIFSADHHARLRDKSHSVNLRIEEVWDLERVSPLFNVPSCVIVAKNASPATERSFKGRVIEATLPKQDLHLDGAAKYLVETNDVTFHIVTMAGRSALSRDVIEVAGGDEYYKRRFHQGADLMPRSFYFVSLAGSSDGDGTVPAETNAKVQANAKGSWREIHMQGLVNRKYLFRTCIAENVLPFVIQDPFCVHLPVERVNAENWAIQRPGEIELSGAIESAEWFRSAAKIYEERKTEKAKSLFEMLNYNNKLLCQNPSQKYWVLFCSSGKNVCSAFFENDGQYWADQKTYWYCSESRNECLYLVGILNAPSLNDIIKPFQSKGLAGERDIHKKILDVGIPRFSSDSDEMRELAEHSGAMHEKATKMLKNGMSGSLAKRRGLIRKQLADEFLELDELVKVVFESENE